MSTQFLTFAISVLRMACWLAILSAVFVPLERLFALHKHKIFRPQVAVDAGYYFLNAFVPGLILGVPMALSVFINKQKAREMAA